MEYFVKVQIKSKDDLPERGEYFVCKNNERHDWWIYNPDWDTKLWMENIDWYLKPVEIPEIPNNTFSWQSTPDLCCGVYEERPLELRICTRCGKEFKSNVDCPICPSCYL